MGILFIVNPKAGKGRAKSIVPLINEVCKENSVEFEIKYTTAPKDGTCIARFGAESGFERIIAVGGDGTVNEVLNGMAGTSSALGVVPGGSGNDFIRTISSEKDLKKIIHVNIYGVIKAADIGKCNGQYFINIASMGCDAEVVIATEGAKKFFSGSLAYIVGVIITIFRYKGKMLKVKVDDQEFEENALLTAIANGRFYGGGMLPAPRADITDGWFDVCFIRHLPRLRMLLLFPKFMKGKHEKIKEVTFYRGKKVILSCRDEMYVNIDGEITKNREMEFEILPEGVNLIMPV
jgi:YegS/Rv2252/BmrU family lipid kinase